MITYKTNAPDDFDDMGAMRRRVCALEQDKADLGIAIGVLKQERSKLWLALDELLATHELREHNGEKITPIQRKAMGAAREALQQVRIDK